MGRTVPALRNLFVRSCSYSPDFWIWERKKTAKTLRTRFPKKGAAVAAMSEPVKKFDDFFEEPIPANLVKQIERLRMVEKD